MVWSKDLNRERFLSALVVIALSAPLWAASSEQDVLRHYADLAYAKYEDSLITARVLQDAVEGLIAEPTETNLATARRASAPRGCR